MDDKKPWYKSKGVINGIVIVLLGTYELVGQHLGPQMGFSLPSIPEFVYVVLGTLGIYTRATAKTALTK